MAVVQELPRQCVIWFGTPLPYERDALSAAGWQVRVADPATESGVGLRSGDIVVGLLDLRDATTGSLARLEQLTREHHYLSMVAIVPARPIGDASAVDRLLERCQESFTMPVELSRLIQGIETVIEPHRPPPCRGIESLVGRSPAMRAAHGSIRKFASVELPVLITGETGTGKDVAARVLHQISKRRDRPFIALNCGALPENLVQSELFGHERGAFTGAISRREGLFESAAGGTVFLDEIGDLPLAAQTNLLRVLQEGTLERVGSHHAIKVDVRVLTATNVDLESAVEQGTFRLDLYFRLNVLRLHMPALSERGDDIRLLAGHFLAAFREKHATRARAFGVDAKRAMAEFAWPGNVRELLNRVQRAAVSADAELITAKDLDLDVIGPAAGTGDLDKARGNAEHDAVLGCLQETGFNISEAARRLKVSRVTVYRLCKKHRLALNELR